MKVQGRTDQQYLTAMSHIIEGLKGDALLVAQAIGMDKLNTEGDSLDTSRQWPRIVDSRNEKCRIPSDTK